MQKPGADDSDINGRCVLEENRVRGGRQLSGDYKKDDRCGIGDRPRNRLPGDFSDYAGHYEANNQHSDQASGARYRYRRPIDRLDQDAPQGPEDRSR